jgi:iron complex outermembrane receptor protein
MSSYCLETSARPNARRPALVLGSSFGCVLVMNAACLGAEASTPNGSGASESGLAEVVVTAPYATPTSTPLNATEPTTVISQEFIQEHIPPSENYDSIVSLAPGVVVTGTDGAGSGRTKIAIRGFTDGQYNITVDGIPLQYQNLTHSTLSYFVSSDIDQVVLDKGPGTSSTVGLATFGGTIAVQTRNPSNTPNFNPYGSVGSYNTYLGGVRGSSGPIGALSDANLLVDAEHLDGDSFTTNSHVDRSNYLLKYLQPVGEHSTVTFLSDFNVTHLNLDVGTSKADLDTFGMNYQLSSNPLQPNYYGYNRDDYIDDFEYLGFNSELARGWTLDAKLYTYSFAEPHQYAANDVTGLTTGTVFGATNIGGALSTDRVRNYGEIINLTDALWFGDIKTGLWFDYQTYHRFSEKYDFTLAKVVPNSVTYNNLGDMSTVQPYVQFDVNIGSRLKVVAGVKYDNFNLGLNAAVNSANGLPLYGATAQYDKVLPAFALNYALTDGAAAYLQIAQAMVVPPPNDALYVANPSLNSIQPQTTTNYQAGVTVQRPGLSFNADAFFIRAENLIESTRNAGNLVVFFSAGDATYKGVEAEVTKPLVGGLDLYANAFLESAKNNQTGLWLPEAPQATAAGGLAYHQYGLYASLLDKWVGARYGLVNQVQYLAPFNTLDFALSYTLQRGGSALGPVSFRLEVNNLLNSIKIDDYVGTSGGSNTPLYLVQGGRNFALTLSVPIGHFAANQASAQ